MKASPFTIDKSYSVKAGTFGLAPLRLSCPIALTLFFEDVTGIFKPDTTEQIVCGNVDN